MPLIRPGIRQLLRIGKRGPGRTERDVDEEIASHLALRAAQLERQGWTPDAARAEALHRFGAVAESRERLIHLATTRERRMTMLESLDALRHDAAYAFRQLRRSPGFTVAAVATLALGLGANATMFGVIDRLFLRPPPGIGDAERVVRVSARMRFTALGDIIVNSFSYPLFEDLRTGASAFDHIAAYSGPTDAPLGRGLEARVVPVTAVSGDYFVTLGVRPALGRFFTASETREPVGERVAVVSYGLWQRKFAGARDVLGRQIDVGGNAFTVVGVAPRGFTGTTLYATDLWLPLSGSAGTVRVARPGWDSDRNFAWSAIVAHLRPGATVGAAAAQVTSISRAFARQGGANSDTAATAILASLVPARAPTLTPRPENQVAALVFGVSILVLLIACANLANLLLVRALGRQREMAVRLALGVRRARLVRMLLVESAMLAVIAGAAAIAVVWLGGHAVRAVLFSADSSVSTLVDARLIAFTAAVAVVMGLITGVGPAIRVSRADLTIALKQGAREGMGHRSRVRTALLLTQGALSVLLLVGAGLFVRSLHHVEREHTGIDLDRVLYVTMNLAAPGETPAQRMALWNRVLDRARATPGVATAALSMGSFFRSSFAADLSVAGHDSIPTVRDGGPYIYAVSPTFFRTLGTRILRGRDFTEADLTGHRVVIVNETMARLIWPRQNAVGQCLYIGGDGKPKDTPRECTEVIGVSESGRREHIVGDTAMQYYVPITRAPAFMQGGEMLMVRTVRPAAEMAETVRRALQAAAPSLPYVRAQPMTDIVAPQLRSWKLGATMFTLFGVLALVLGTLGAYSVLSYVIAQRAHEMGVRAALGASQRDIIRLVVRQGVAVSVVSIVLGVSLSLAGGRFVAPLLFHVSPHDPVVFGAVVVLLLATAVLAAVAPARRASRVDPMTALRVE